MRRAFSLTELLVVLAIIAVLAAMIFPAMGIIRRKATESRCRALLAKVSTAIEAYQQDRKQLPVWQGSWVSGGWAWVEANNTMLYTELHSTDPDVRTNPRKGYLIGELRPAELSGRSIVDPWGKPLIYYAQPWAGTSAGAKPFTGNQTAFELWSAGPDMAFDILRGNASDQDNIPARPYDPSWQR